jgi:hypothetical protein
VEVDGIPGLGLAKEGLACPTPCRSSVRRIDRDSRVAFCLKDEFGFRIARSLESKSSGMRLAGLTWGGPAPVVAMSSLL